MTRKKIVIGDERWFVEWCSGLAFIDEAMNEVDIDNCVMKQRAFRNKEQAEEFAKRIWPMTTKTFGVVDYWHSRFVPYDEADALRFPTVGFWEPCSEVEHYEGPES